MYGSMLNGNEKTTGRAKRYTNERCRRAKEKVKKTFWRPRFDARCRFVGAELRTPLVARGERAEEMDAGGEMVEL